MEETLWYIPVISMEYTWCDSTTSFESKCITSGIEPMTTCILRSYSDHCATSMDTTDLFYMVYMHNLGR